MSYPVWPTLVERRKGEHGSHVGLSRASAKPLPGLGCWGCYLIPAPSRRVGSFNGEVGVGGCWCWVVESLAPKALQKEVFTPAVLPRFDRRNTLINLWCIIFGDAICFSAARLQRIPIPSHPIAWGGGPLTWGVRFGAGCGPPPPPPHTQCQVGAGPMGLTRRPPHREALTSET